jgi:hypothetical protein
MNARTRPYVYGFGTAEGLTEYTPSGTYTPAQVARLDRRAQVLARGWHPSNPGVYTVASDTMRDAETARRLPRDHRAGVALRAAVRRVEDKSTRYFQLEQHLALAELAHRERLALDPLDLEAAELLSESEALDILEHCLLASAADSVWKELAAAEAADALAELAHRERLALQADARRPEALDPLDLGTVAEVQDAPPPPRETEPQGAALIATAHAAQAPPCPATGVCLSAPGGQT